MQSKEIVQEGGKIGMDQLYTVDEMMHLLKVSRPKIYTLMKRNEIPFIMVGGQRRFVGKEVMKALRDRTKNSAGAVQTVQNYV